MRISSTALVFLCAFAQAITCLFVLQFEAQAKHCDLRKKVRTEAKQAVDDQAIFSFKQTGGFMATNKHYDRKLSELPTPERQELEKLINASGLSGVKNEERLTKGAADVFYYDFRLKEPGHDHHIVFDDVTLPPPYRELVKYLRDKVITEKR